MRLRVVPVELFVTSPDFITVPLDEEWTSIEDEPLQDDEPDIVVEKDLSRYTSESMSAAYEGQGRAADRPRAFGQCIEEELVILGSTEWVAHATARISPFKLGEPP